MKIERLTQPTKTSCGPTSVAMLVGIPARQAIEQLKAIRSRRTTTHGSTVGEMARLLDSYGYRLGRRIKNEEPPASGVCMLRVEKSRGSNWHWALLVDGVVYDPSPSKADVRRVGDYSNRTVSFYEVDRAS